MGGQTSAPLGYSKAAVLLTRWAEPTYSSAARAEESRELCTIFEDLYGYSTETCIIDGGSRDGADAQLANAVAKFVAKHDGPAGSTLLVVYYSGYGAESSDPAGLVMLRERDMRARSSSVEYPGPSVCWDRAEKHLREAQADVLEVLDCDSASSAGFGSPVTGAPGRCFNTMAAAPRRMPTPDPGVPGEKTYTHALIQGLREMAERCQSDDTPSFSTAFLTERVRELMLEGNPVLRHAAALREQSRAQSSKHASDLD